MFVTVTYIKIIIGHFHCSFTFVTINREPVIYVTNYAGVTII